LKKQTEVYNNAIKEATELAGDKFFVADLFGSRLNNDFYYNNTVDGLHPDQDGMRIIAEIIEDAIVANLK
jgi:lysophospholipase L1-like esterase